MMWSNDLTALDATTPLGLRFGCRWLGASEFWP